MLFRSVVALTSWISLTHEDNTKIPMRTVTDATGTEVVIPQHPKRVVILNSANLDMYYAVGGTVVGKPTSSYISKEIREKTKDVPAVGTLHSPSVEAIIGLHPDLVIGINVPFSFVTAWAAITISSCGRCWRRFPPSCSPRAFPSPIPIPKKIGRAHV